MRLSPLTMSGKKLRHDLAPHVIRVSIMTLRLASSGLAEYRRSAHAVERLIDHVLMLDMKCFEPFRVR